VVEEENLGFLEETLKGGQPSYLIKNGRTVRIDYLSKMPSHFAVYFHCQTILIEVFKEVYGDIFKYEGTRALIFSTDDELAVPELKKCLSMALRYHKIKYIPLLGT
jgi:hypothetical protein